MMARPLPYPILSAVAHGIAACGIVALVATLWSGLLGTHDALTALTTVGGIGVLAWGGAALATPRPRRAANDNAPLVMVQFAWRPVLDFEAARILLSR